MDTNIENFLEQTVTKYMQRGDAFTSLDITNQAKDVGHRIRNHEVAVWLRSNAVRISYNWSYQYNQTLITVDSKAVGQTLAYLYHHYQEDADVYLDRDQNPKSFQQVGIVSGCNVGFQWPTSIPKIAATPVYFATREGARSFARGNSDDYKFADQGNYSVPGERWSCIPR